jgi:hypothetical protein
MNALSPSNIPKNLSFGFVPFDGQPPKSGLQCTFEVIKIVRPFWIKFVAYLIIITMVVSAILFSIAYAV